MFSHDEVLTVLKRCNVRKASGPDAITNTLLRTSSNQLGPVFNRLFNICAAKGQIPKLWKLSNIKPLPKKSVPLELNDYRPIALTSCVMKCMEKLIKNRLLRYTSLSADPLQFAYKAKRSTADARNILQQTIIDHAERANSYSRVLFLDYSSAFNTLISSLLSDRLRTMGVCETLVPMINCFLSNTQQYVSMSDHVSDRCTTNTGVPQGCVLSPLLFTIYTDPLTSNCPDVKILKYADDTAIVGLITKDDETNYHHEISRAMVWCGENNLLLNTAKTKEMLVNFTTKSPPSLSLDSTQIERVEKLKYLGMFLTVK
jgi:hypothetical protein